MEDVRRAWNSVGVRVEGRETGSGGSKVWYLYWVTVVMLCGFWDCERIDSVLLETC